MTVETKLGPTAYHLALTAAEREQLLLALELAVATRRGEPERAVLLRDVDAELADRLADRLYLAASGA